MSLTLRHGAPAAPRAATRLLHGLVGGGVPDPGLRHPPRPMGRAPSPAAPADRRARGERAGGPRWGVVPRGGQVAGGRRGLAPPPGRGGQRCRRRTRQPQGRIAALAGTAPGARRTGARGQHAARPAGHRVRPGLEHSDRRGRTCRAPRPRPRSDRHRARRVTRHVHLRSGVGRRQCTRRAPGRSAVLCRADDHPRARGRGPPHPGAERRDARPCGPRCPLRSGLVPRGRHASRTRARCC